MAYRIEFREYDKTWRVVFTDDTPPRLLLNVMSFEKRPGWQNASRWAAGIAVAGAAAVRRGGKRGSP